MNNKISLIISIIALLGVGYLLMNSTKKTAEIESTPDVVEDTVEPTDSKIKIAYINNDSLYQKTDFIVEANDALIAAQQKAEGNINWKLKDAEKKAQQLIEESQSYTTAEQGQAAQEKYAQLELSVQNYRENESNKLVELQYESNKKILNKLDKYLEQYSTNNNIDYIFMKSPGLSFVYGDKANDITEDFINVINSDVVSTENIKDSIQ